MFRGVSTLSLDAKGRVAIPKRYRERLQECCDSKLVITIDRDRCLLIYPLPEWEEVEHKLKKLPTLDKTARALQRLYIGHATEVEMDSQGRVLLAPELRKFANLSRQAVLIGQGDKLELWDEAHWNSQCDDWLETATNLEEIDLSGELGSLSF